ncbi:MAG: MarR family transcriptional regulator [Rhodanobacter sp.]
MARLTNCIQMLDEGMTRVSQSVPDMPVPEGTLVRLLLLSGTALQQELEHKLKPHKLSDSEFLTLMILFSRPDGSSSPSELCEHTSQGATNMTRIANALVKRGLITRRASTQDRRRVLIHITAAGRRSVGQMLPPLFPRLRSAFIDFSDTDKHQLSRLLRKLASNLDQMDMASVL